MAKKKKKNQQRKPWFDDLSPHAKQAIVAVLVAVLGIFLAFSLFGYGGRVGGYTTTALDFLFGGGAWLAPVVCAFYVYALLNPREDDTISTSKIFGIALLFISTLGFLALSSEQLGGWVGRIVEYPLTYLVGGALSYVILIAFTLISLFFIFNVGLPRPKKKELEPEEEEDYVALSEDEPDSDAEEAPEEDETDDEPEPEMPASKRGLGDRLGLTGKSSLVVSSFEGPYDPPPLSLLQKDRGRAKGGDVKANSNIIKRTLKNFNIEVEVDDVKTGPTVTQYAIKPAEGIRISKIVNLQSNLELALAASPIRIEAPIPGKSLVGIEVPNSHKQQIGLASLLSTAEFTDSPKPLLVALGKDITGHSHFANVGKMPHALIAGTTGSGKSVLINCLITSLLFRNSPDQLRFIMVDPKRVELTPYNGIPHLLTPVINDAKKTILSLKWAIKEMDRRYQVLETEGVRDIDSYHQKIYQPALATRTDEEEETPEPLPFIVIFIDELSDLMSVYPRELEALIVRLTQKSRAVGIHLIIATQRPEVKVITGLIKANMPTRIALRVNSVIDSRTILDQTGADKLLGYGDMLFSSQESAKPIRLQSPLISEDEVKRVVDYLKNQSDAQSLDAIDLGGSGGDNDAGAVFDSLDEDEDDDLYEEAKETVITAGKASTSFLQRKLRVGYSRAARLIDLLEERGVIGAGEGAKPREILVNTGEETGDPDRDEEESS